MSDQNIFTSVEYAAQYIQTARYVVVFTGAGISTPSGIPDFRGERNGLWKKNDPMQVASLTSFQKKPAVFYDWFRPLFELSWSAEPNQAHCGLARLEEKRIIKSIITQNIDGLHQKSGAHQVIELHGSALVFSCPHCHMESNAGQVHQAFSEGVQIPVCSKCGVILKPEITLFEEMLPYNAWQEAEDETRKADLMLVIGSSLEVYPASTIPMLAVENGSRLIINNLSPTQLDSQADLLIPMNAADFIPALVNLLI